MDKDLLLYKKMIFFFNLMSNQRNANDSITHLQNKQILTLPTMSHIRVEVEQFEIFDISRSEN